MDRRNIKVELFLGRRISAASQWFFAITDHTNDGRIIAESCQGYDEPDSARIDAQFCVGNETEIQFIWLDDPIGSISEEENAPSV